jgi:hypothetical protein
MAKPKVNFSRRDLLLTILCTLFALANLAAVGSTGRRRAKEAVCLSNLRQWGAIFEMFVNDNNGWFFNGEGSGNGYWWMDKLRAYNKDDKLRLCPEAAKTPEGIPLSEVDWSHAAWRAGRVYNSNGDIGSYGLNSWICNPRPGITGLWGRNPPRYKIEHYFRSPYYIAADRAPVFLASWWVDGWSLDTDIPPPRVFYDDRPCSNEIGRFCVDRHEGGLGCLFMDWSARNVGLKELWTLKWHRSFNTAGPWTKAGGVRPTNWPIWMKDFKDF